MINFPFNPIDQQTHIVGQVTYRYSSSTTSWSAVKSPYAVDFVTDNRILVRNTTNATSTNTGALVVYGGAGVGKDLWVGGDLYAGGYKVITTQDYVPVPGGGGSGIAVGAILAGTGTAVDIVANVATVWSTATLQTVTDVGFETSNPIVITNTTPAYNTFTGALIVTGGAGIGGDLWAGNIYSNGSLIVSGGTFVGGTISGATHILDATVSVSTDTGALIVDGGVGIGGDLWAGNIYSNGSLIVSSGTFIGGTISGATHVKNSTSATSTITGALVVDGGVGIGQDLWVQGNVYSENGRPLYTPSVTVSLTVPPTARVGDFWIDPSAGVEYQYIQDGTSTFWIQFVGI